MEWVGYDTAIISTNVFTIYVSGFTVREDCSFRFSVLVWHDSTAASDREYTPLTILLSCRT